MAHTGPDTLHSDHVNYLIFRYLQEAGHERTANTFAHEWYRPREYRDAETLPFAPAVQRNELISVIQSGLRYDELRARMSSHGREHRWTLHGDARLPRESVENDDTWHAPPQREREFSRPLSSEKRKAGLRASVGVSGRALDDFPTPAPKRQRISRGSEEVHINGDKDAMDVDAMSASDAEDADGEPVSPGAASDDAVVNLSERYDSMDVAIQTDIVSGPKTSTLSFAISKPLAQIYSCKFAPVDSDATLLVTGRDMCHLYRTPSTLEHAVPDLGPLDLFAAGVQAGSTVGASSWHPTASQIVCAIDPTENDDGPKAGCSVIGVSMELGRIDYLSEPNLLEPPGVVLCIHYSPSGEYITVLRSNAETSVVQVFGTLPNASSEVTSHGPIAWAVVESTVRNAEWLGDDVIVVTGDRGVFECYKLSLADAASEPFTPENTKLRNLVELTGVPVAGASDWTDLACHREDGCLALVSAPERRLVVAKYEDRSVSMHKQIQLDERLEAAPTCMAFETGKGAQLAVGCEDGTCYIYSGSNRTDSKPFEETRALDLSEPVLAVAWSPDDQILAVAGTDIVRFWKSTGSMDGHPAMSAQPFLTWRPPRAEVNGLVNGASKSDDSEEGITEPSLSWSADGTKLAFAEEKEIHVIYFRSSLSRSLNVRQMNGGASP